MSEYQYYDFRALERPLTREEQQELRRISSRAEISARQFVNIYNYGDLKADPANLVEQYFDAFAYSSNFGHYQLMFRLPRRAVDLDTLSLYCPDQPATVKLTKDAVILDFNSVEDASRELAEEVDEDYVEDLISLRADILRGDMRPLYIAWLAGAASWFEDERREPPVPAGLGQLTEPLEKLVLFLDVPESLLKVAAQASEPLPQKSAKKSAAEEQEAFVRWALERPPAMKDGWISRFLRGDEDVLRAELLNQYRDHREPRSTIKKRATPRFGTRTVGEMRLAAEQLEEEEERRSVEEEQQRQAREERRRIEERSKYLTRLATRAPETWQRVEELIQSKKPAGYNEAVRLLIDLRDLAHQEGETTAFRAKLTSLLAAHGTKSALIRRLDTAQLLSETL